MLRLGLAPISVPLAPGSPIEDSQGAEWRTKGAGRPWHSQDV